MFQQQKPPTNIRSQMAIASLALLSFTALIVTVWILTDFSHQQKIVEELTRHLPDSDLPEANELAGEIRLQWRLSVLLILNIVASAVAIALLVKAYLSSERSLRDARVLATDILDSIDQGVITTDREGNILSINPYAQKLLNKDETGMGVALKDLPKEHGTLNKIRLRVLQSQQRVSEQDYTVMNNGTDLHLRAGGSLLRDHGQKHLGMVLHVHDVTEKTLIEQRLRRMERYMGLGSLAAGLQHEIKNPLSALALHVQLLDEALEAEQPQPDVQEMLAVIKSETRRISAVLEGFRDFASVAELNCTEVAIPELVEKLVRLIQPQARQQKIQLAVELPKDAEATLSIDAVRIEQVLLNLALNAMAAMQGGGELTISVVPSPDSVQINVIDTGGGIPEGLRDRVFDPYFTTRSTGTGMGLALSEKIVRQHNGSIDFQTGPDGTVFTITLPRK